ncbi:hypothetical protein [Methanococcus aeolicus]|uniref:hypothetical protein n=1 Tax=Methanococcus aeolicus TaxID=42879 RepID=UPI0021C82020|nr:hypothetical protein [Methanococcus aeolicus]UXM84658.1 hypothetical protein N6C89_07950 [Methanococcus aeolicus]
MSKALFLSNVGNRDLGFGEIALFDKTKDAEEGPKRLREKCDKKYQEITEKNLNLKSFFEFTKELYLSKAYEELNLEPILIKDSIKSIYELYDEMNIKLLATMQENSHNQDTYYSAEIIKEWLIRKYPKLKGNVEIVKINKNPSDYALMLEEYSTIFNKFSNDYDDVYLGITGGAPAQISSLIINGVLRWETKTKIFYKPHGKKPQENNIGEMLFKKFKNEEYDAYMDSEMYLLASEVGKKYGLIEDWEYYKLRALHFKNLFDFEQAVDEFNKAFKKANIDNKKHIRKEIKSLEKLDSNEPTKDIKENINRYKLLINLLIDTMIRKWKNGDYVDFVGRLFRLEEAVLITIVEKEFNKSMDKEKGKFQGYEELLEENPDVKKYLIEGHIQVDKGVNRNSLFYLVGYLIDKKGFKKYKPIHDIIIKLNNNNKTKKTTEKLKKVECLLDLRNKSVLAHGFIGVSKKNIIELYNEDKSNENEIINDIDLIKRLINKLI